jgi:GAF domain-containing protein
VVGDDDDVLRSSLEKLSSLLIGNLALEETLTHVAGFAVEAIPGADGVGLTVVADDRPDAMVASDDFVRAVDAVQYGIGEGPCITAVRERRVVSSGSLGGEPAWPRFGARVGRLGVHSALSLPLILSDDEVIGALNVYAHAKHAFDERAVHLGVLFAAPAAVSVRNAQVLADSQQLVGQLSDAIAGRAMIDRAIGIMMSRSGGTPEQALERLRTVSQHEHTKMVQIAVQIVDDATRRARGRPGPAEGT